MRKKREHVSFQRRPFLMPLWLTAVAAALLLSFTLFLVFAAWTWGTADATTVIVIRHAETDPGALAGADPPLTPAGQARAELLAHMFGDADSAGHIDAIYVLPALRDRLTAAPLAVRLKVNAAVDPAEDAAGLARRALREHSGGRVLIVAHSDTLPAIVAALTRNTQIPKIGEDEFGTMYVVTVPRIGHAIFLRFNY